jgi:integrase
MPVDGTFTRYAVVDRSGDPRRARSPFECRLHRTEGRPSSKFFKTEREAHAYGAKMLARPTAGTRGRPFADVADEWLALQRTMDLKATTIAQYERHLRTWVVPAHGRWGLRDHRVTSVSGGDILRLLGEMQAQGRSGSTRKQVFGLIGMICDYALSEGLIHTNPQEQVPRSRRPSNKRSRAPQPLTREEAHAIHDWIAEQRQELHVDYAMIVLLGFYLGVRFSEIASIRRRDLALPARTLHVANPAKHGDERTIPLLGPTADAVRAYVERLELPPEALLFPSLGGRTLPAAKVRRAKEMRAQGAVLRQIAEELGVSIAIARTYAMAQVADRPRGTTPVDRGFYRLNIWDPAVDAVGMPSRQFRDLRNSCIRALLTGDIDGRRWPPDLVQQFIGHSDSRMTMDVYHQIYDTDVHRFAFSEGP